MLNRSLLAANILFAALNLGLHSGSTFNLVAGVINVLAVIILAIIIAQEKPNA